MLVSRSSILYMRENIESGFNDKYLFQKCYFYLKFRKNSKIFKYRIAIVLDALILESLKIARKMIEIKYEKFEQDGIYW